MTLHDEGHRRCERRRGCLHGGGREYIVMPFGGNSHIRGDNGATVSPLGDALIAFALPTNKPSAPRIVDATPCSACRCSHRRRRYPGAPAVTRLIEIKAHDLNYYPDHFTVKAGGEGCCPRHRHRAVSRRFRRQSPGAVNRTFSAVAARPGQLLRLHRIEKARRVHLLQLHPARQGLREPYGGLMTVTPN